MLLLHGDCLEVMKTLPDRSVDLFLCDLPYGCLSGQKTGGGCTWDIAIDLAQFWAQVKRLCKDEHTPVLMFCSTKFGFDLYNSNPDWFRYDLVWSKGNGTGFLMANKMPMRSHEMVYVFAKKGATYTRKDITGDFQPSHSRGRALHLTTNTFNGGQPLSLAEVVDNTHTRCVLSVIEMNRCGRTKGNHPTQKPDDLYEWLITRYSKPGDTVLDPTAGSFASVFTAERLGRKGIGIEKDDAFYAKAVSIRGEDGEEA
jgi:site-specific DNA-methyltransferase (adenine-specific)